MPGFITTLLSHLGVREMHLDLVSTHRLPIPLIDSSSRIIVVIESETGRASFYLPSLAYIYATRDAESARDSRGWRVYSIYRVSQHARVRRRAAAPSTVSTN